MKYAEYNLDLKINASRITTIRIGDHYKLKHGSYMNDRLILELVQALDGGTFKSDSNFNGIAYYAADINHVSTLNQKRCYRLIWLFEGDALEILGIVNAYRRKKKRKGI